MSTLYSRYRDNHPINNGYLPNDCMDIDNDLREGDHDHICEKSLIMLLQRMQEEIDDLRQEVQDLKDWKYDINYQMDINDH